jgi:Na+/proline symporter
MGRLSGFVITMLGVVYAIYLIKSVLYTFLLTETLATFVGISVLAGVMWPRANRWGALASVVTALTVNFLLYWKTGQRLDYWDANIFLAALAGGVAAMVIVSLATAPEPSSHVDPFFERLETSSDGPADRAVRAPLLLVHALNPARGAGRRGWRAYREDLNGFALGWVIVIVLVAGTAWLLAP